MPFLGLSRNNTNDLRQDVSKLHIAAGTRTYNGKVESSEDRHGRALVSTAASSKCHAEGRALSAV